MADNSKNLGIAGIVAGIVLLVLMFLWAYFILRDHDCLKCFLQAIGVFLGIGLALGLLGFGYFSINKKKD